MSVDPKEEKGIKDKWNQKLITPSGNRQDILKEMDNVLLDLEE